MSNGEATFDPEFIPEPGRNNIWYRRSDIGTVLVFVHGVLSDSRSCWLSKTEQTQEYWPRLIAGDELFKDVGIYLGGYYTAVDAGRYEIRNAADELRDALSRGGDSAVLSNNRIIFICHSTGGIVVRYILINNTDHLLTKQSA
jgi:hypothetical protein